MDESHQREHTVKSPRHCEVWARTTVMLRHRIGLNVQMLRIFI